jgi:hypothetical protein
MTTMAVIGPLKANTILNIILHWFCRTIDSLACAQQNKNRAC